MAEQSTVTPAGSKARIFDTFTRQRPVQGAGDSAKELSNALGVAMKPVAEMGEKYKEDEIERAKAFSLGMSAETTAIRTEEIRPTEGVYFMKALDGIQGERSILSQKNTWLHEMATDERINNSRDPAVLDSFLSSKLSGATEGMNPYQKAGAYKAAEEFRKAATSRFLQRADALAVVEVEESVTQRSHNLFEDYATGAVDAEAFTAKFNEIDQDAHRGLPLKPERSRELLLESAINQATKAKDTAVLDAYPKKFANGTPTLNAALEKKLEAAKASIEVDRFSQQKRERTEDDWRREDAGRQAVAEAVTSKDPITKERIDEITAISPTYGKTLQAMQDRRMDANFSVDKRAEAMQVAQVREAINKAARTRNPRDEQAVYTMLNNGFQSDVLGTDAFADLHRSFTTKMEDVSVWGDNGFAKQGEDDFLSTFDEAAKANATIGALRGAARLEWQKRYEASYFKEMDDNKGASLTRVQLRALNEEVTQALIVKYKLLPESSQTLPAAQQSLQGVTNSTDFILNGNGASQ